jgi:arylsulfatase B
MFNRNYSRGFDMRRNDKVADNLNQTYATDLFSREAVKVIEGHDLKKPLFLLLNHLAPHAGKFSKTSVDNVFSNTLIPGNEDNPMQAPADEIKKFDYIKNEKRRTLAGQLVGSTV